MELRTTRFKYELFTLTLELGSNCSNCSTQYHMSIAAHVNIEQWILTVTTCLICTGRVTTRNGNKMRFRARMANANSWELWRFMECIRMAGINVKARMPFQRRRRCKLGDGKLHIFIRSNVPTPESGSTTNESTLLTVRLMTFKLATCSQS